jgi:hypothetical protein
MILFGGQRLVDTQPDPTITIRGISPYSKTNCYVVTAYKGSAESADSNQWCGASNLAMGMASVRLYATLDQTRQQMTPTSCSPNPQTSIENGILEEAVSPEPYHSGGGLTECGAADVYHAYAGFKLNIHGRIWKALFVIAPQSGPGTCDLTGVVKTTDVRWFDQSVATLTPTHLGQTPGIAFLQTNHSTQRPLDFNANDPIEPTADGMGIADVTPWFPSGGLSDLGVGFTSIRIPNPSYTPSSQNPSNDFEGCNTNLGRAWLDIQYYPSS